MVIQKERREGAIDNNQKILFERGEIEKRIKELGAQISRDYSGKELFVIGILKGAVIFLSDLVRNIEVPLKIDFMAVSSYGASTKSSGIVRTLKDLDQSVEGRDILIVEDIVDTGLTLKFLCDNLWQRHPKSLKIVTLLDKPDRRVVDIKPDYSGFVIPDHFVVGFGLDHNEYYRHLPHICILNE